MSEYPIDCDSCGKFIGYVHATQYGSYLCEKCSHDIKIERELKELGKKEK